MLTTAYGKPFSVKGFGHFMSAAIASAGLPGRCKAHGLRKAAARRLAEVGCTPHQIMAVTGHKTLAEVERYTRAAEQKRLNKEALEKQLANNKVPNSQPRIAKPIENAAEKTGLALPRGLPPAAARRWPCPGARGAPAVRVAFQSAFLVAAQCREPAGQ